MLGGHYETKKGLFSSSSSNEQTWETLFPHANQARLIASGRGGGARDEMRGGGFEVKGKDDGTGSKKPFSKKVNTFLSSE